MTTLRFGIHQIPPAEAGLIHTLFRLYAHGKSNFKWSLVSEAPYDAILINTTVDEDAESKTFSATIKAVLKLTNFNASTAPDVLERPIRSEKLEAWLLRIQAAHLADASPTPLSITAAGVAVDAVAAASAPSGTDTSVTRFKLLRWPPVVLLRNDPQLVRMATLLSRRAMKVEELAALAQLPLARAQDFINVLEASKVLKVQTLIPTSVQTPALAMDTSPSPLNQPAQKAKRSLVSRIRFRLGL